MQHFCQLAHGVVNTSDGKIIAAFIAGVRDNRCCEELGICKPSTISELYALVDKCARAKEGRLAPKRVAQAANDPFPSTKKPAGRKRAPKQVLAMEQGFTADKKAKANTPEVAAVAPTQGTWCPIHSTSKHDIKSSDPSRCWWRNARSVMPTEMPVATASPAISRDTSRESAPARMQDSAVMVEVALGAGEDAARGAGIHLRSAAIPHPPAMKKSAQLEISRRRGISSAFTEEPPCSLAEALSNASRGRS
jgi:hypothetical protein